VLRFQVITRDAAKAVPWAWNIGITILIYFKLDGFLASLKGRVWWINPTYRNGDHGWMA
jgi:hypothetical protein